MFSYLSYFQLDQTSFWLGFLAATLFWWLLGRLRPQLGPFWKWVRQTAQAGRQDLFANLEVQFRNAVQKQAQGMHLAALLFSLDEVILPPRLLAPPQPVEPGFTPSAVDITDGVVLYLPDWPEVAAAYNAPSLSLAEALQGTARIVVFGPSGSGKTVVLADLAAQLARRDPACGAFVNHLPILIHAADLLAEAPQPGAPIEHWIQALTEHNSVAKERRLPAFLKLLLQNERALLLLDGLDELPPNEAVRVVKYLEHWLSLYPDLPVAVAASDEHFGPLTTLGFTPLAVMPWNEGQRSAFILKWGNLWTRIIVPPAADGVVPVELALLPGWLQTDVPFMTPLEITLKVWAAYAGDVVGPTPLDSLEAYARRLTAFSPQARPLLRGLAVHMMSSPQGVITQREAESGLGQLEPLPRSAKRETGSLKPGTGQLVATLSGSLVSSLVDNGLLTRRCGSSLSFTHNAISSYLAAQALDLEPRDKVTRLLDWSGKNQILRCLAARQAEGDWIVAYVDETAYDPLFRRLFKAARWLRDAPAEATWRSAILRQLADIFQHKDRALGMRLRAMAALCFTNSQGISMLLRQSLTSPSLEIRQAAALGCGILREAKSVPDVSPLLGDPSPVLRRTACLALTAIGDKAALETVATVLLQGDEEIRRLAAEALSNNQEEGHPTLTDGSKMQEDVLVRWASVAGLARIPRIWPSEAWVFEILETISAQEEQWVVKNAASQALDLLRQLNPRTPRPLITITEQPWLIAYAGEQGVGVAPGKPVLDLVIRALKGGKEEQRLAAIHTLQNEGGEAAITPLYQVYFGERGEVREAALLALWRLAAAGIELPSPEKFGL